MPTRWQTTEDNLTALNTVTNQLQTAIASHDASIAELLQSSQTTNTQLQSTQSQLKTLTTSVNDLLTHIARLQKAPEQPPPSSSNPPPFIHTPPPKSTPPPSPFPFEIRPIRLDISSFDGSNPGDWILQTERYFAIHNTPETHRIQAASFFFRGEALSWFNWLYQNQQLPTWPEFCRALELRFGPSSFVNHEAALYKLYQHSTVAVYQSEFETLSNRVYGLSPRALLNCFLSGLKPEIHRELQILQPNTTSEAMGMARLIEDKLASQTLIPSPMRSSVSAQPLINNSSTQPPLSTTVHPPSSLPPPTGPQSVFPFQLKSITQPSMPSSNLNQTPFRKLTPLEVQQRRDKGLCFKCDDKFGPGHKCKAQFHSIVHYPDPIPLHQDPLINLDPDPP